MSGLGGQDRGVLNGNNREKKGELGRITFRNLLKPALNPA